VDQVAAKRIMLLPLERSSRSLGTDELNICEFPLASTGRAASKGQTSLVFEDEIKDRGTGEMVKRKLIVLATKEFGLPTPADSDVLLVLMHLTNTRNSFTDPTVQFTRYELVRFLGWPLCGKSYRRLDESLNRFVNVTLNYNRAWWSRDVKRWQSKSFHILESVDLRGKGDHADDGPSTFTWSQVILESFKAQQTKRLDLETYFRLKLPTARQAYRFLDKRFYKTKLLNFQLRMFACEHVGLSRTYDNGQLKRKLQPAIEELEAVGFLKALPQVERYTKTQPGEWCIRLIRAGDAGDQIGHRDDKTLPADDEPKAPIVEQLTQRGLSDAAARELAAQHPAEHIRAKIALLDWRTSQGGQQALKNPAGFLAAAIREDYQPPARPSTPQRPKRRPAGPPAAVAVAGESLAERQRLDAARAYLASLPPDEQTRLEALAVEQGNGFQVATYQRLKSDGGKLWDEVRDLLIADYLRQQSGSPV